MERPEVEAGTALFGSQWTEFGWKEEESLAVSTARSAGLSWR